MLLVLGGLLIGQNVNLLPVDASVNAPIYDELFRVLFSIGTILFVGIVGLIVFSLVRFRRRPGQLGDGIALEGNLPSKCSGRRCQQSSFSLSVFTATTSTSAWAAWCPWAMATTEQSAPVPTPALQINASGEEVPPKDSQTATGSAIAPLPIEVTAMQFAFLFHYPDGDFISGELHVPADRPVSLKMEAKDVIHAFWIPEFRLKQDVIPGN